MEQASISSTMPPEILAPLLTRATTYFRTMQASGLLLTGTSIRPPSMQSGILGGPKLKVPMRMENILRLQPSPDRVRSPTQTTTRSPTVGLWRDEPYVIDHALSRIGDRHNRGRRRCRIRDGLRSQIGRA